MKDFAAFSRTITEAHAKLKALEAECLKETGQRYDDKALEMACRWIADDGGTCPRFAHGMDFDCNCMEKCDDTVSWQCWMKYFREKE